TGTAQARRRGGQYGRTINSSTIPQKCRVCCLTHFTGTGGLDPLRLPEATRDVVPLHSLAQAIHRRTDGNPLFMVNVVDTLMAEGVLTDINGLGDSESTLVQATVALPENLRQLIEQQIEQLTPDERRVLEVASVVGMEFSAATVAAGLEHPEEAVEEQCAELARRGHFLDRSGNSEWPDGTLTTCFRFQHALYPEVLYERLSAGRRVKVHRAIGEREEQGYGERARERAAELAAHFERGRDYHKAVQYLQQAGETAVRRSAHQEAISLLTHGLELLQLLPDSPERTQQEIALQLVLSMSLAFVEGYGAPAVEKACLRALDLGRQLGETPQIVPALTKLSVLYCVQGKLQTAREMAERALLVAKKGTDHAALLMAHHALGSLLFFPGEFIHAREHLEQALALYDPQQHHHSIALFWEADLGVSCLSRLSQNLWILGYPDQALQSIHAAFNLAQELSHPMSLAYPLGFAATVHLHRREAQAAQEHAEAEMAFAREHGLFFYVAEGTLLRARALTVQGREEEGLAQLRQILAALLATGAEVIRPVILAWIADTHRRLSQIEEGLAALAEAWAVVDKIGPYFAEGQLYRLKGELTLAREVKSQRAKVKNKKSEHTDPRPLNPDPQGEAGACFLKAIEIARRQHAKSFELQATMSLARLWQQQGKKTEARHMLADIYNWFTEGFDTKDLQEAKGLLEELNH
ncbi:MAG: tetratricopeptide repeat protein, partial [Candidatus Binatia bacterium]